MTILRIAALSKTVFFVGFDPSVRETSQSDGPAGRSYAYQEFSNLGAVKVRGKKPKDART